MGLDKSVRIEAIIMYPKIIFNSYMRYPPNINEVRKKIDFTREFGM